MAIDTGGTFTDLIVADRGGAPRFYKALTTPHDLPRGVFAAIEQAAAERGVTVGRLLGETEVIIHGTTVTTNAVLTRSGARVGLLTTEGFRDLLNMRRGIRERQYDSRQAPPPQLVPRRRIIPVRERIDSLGSELVPLDREATSLAGRWFQEEGVQSVAVAFLFSFLNPDHERTARELLGQYFPEAAISLSSDILPEVRAYERISTTVLNAYVSPLLAAYLGSLEHRLRGNGFAGALLIVQSNGGVMAPEMSARFAVHTALSGPAAAPRAAAYYCDRHHRRDFITIDVGGTSFDVSMARDGTPDVTVEGQIAGYRIAVPMLDIHTIGAGGGSVAWIDELGLLRVGPQSMGANPGPACYGLGGQEPTVTDADLLLGYLDGQGFWGGRMELDVKRAAQAVTEKIAGPLGIDLLHAASGIFEVVNSQMAEAISVVSVQKGYDPREFTLVVGGGAGPIHAADIASRLDIPHILIPKSASLLCAMGMLFSDLRHDFSQTFHASIEQLDFVRLNVFYTDLTTRAIDTLAKEGIPRARIEVQRWIDLRYIGQFHEVRVLLPTEEEVSSSSLASVVAAFHKRHEELFGYAMPEAPVESVNLRMTAVGRIDKPAFADQPYRGPDPSPAFKGMRSAFLDGSFRDVPVYDGSRLGNGNVIRGPAIVEEPSTTVVVPQRYRLLCDPLGNYLLSAEGADGRASRDSS